MSGTRGLELPWIVKVDSTIVARFEQERDAKGFARARYPKSTVYCKTVSDFQRIYQTIQNGTGTAPEIAKTTAVDIRIVWTTITKLKRQGKIRKVGVQPDPPYRVTYEAVA